MPKDFKPALDNLKDVGNRKISPNIQTVVNTGHGYLVEAEKEPETTVREFRESIKSQPESIVGKTVQQREDMYWEGLQTRKVQYGSDHIGTLFKTASDGKKLSDYERIINPQDLGTPIDLMKGTDLEIDGINTPMLYFSMPLSSIGWHIEDQKLLAYSFMHYVPVNDRKHGGKLW